MAYTVLFSDHQLEASRSAVVYMHCFCFMSCVFYFGSSRKLKVLVVVIRYCDSAEEKGVGSVVNTWGTHEAWGSVCYRVSFSFYSH